MPFSEIDNAIKQNNEQLALESVARETELFDLEVKELALDTANNSNNPDLKFWFHVGYRKNELEKKGKLLQRIVKKCNKKWGEENWKK